MNNCIFNDLNNHLNYLRKKNCSRVIKNNIANNSKFLVKSNGIILDFSRQKIVLRTLKLLFKLACYRNLKFYIKCLFNETYFFNKKYFYVRYRNPFYRYNFYKLERFVNFFYSGFYKGFLNESIINIVNIGIGGSDIGVKMVCTALNFYKIDKNKKFYFLSDVNKAEISSVLSGINFSKSIFIFNSKSFSTLETIFNFAIITDYFKSNLKKLFFRKHIFAVTSNINDALRFGIHIENIFKIEDWACGRFSIWSSSSLIVALYIGIDNFYNFIAGAYDIDLHFKNSKFECNIPILMALLSIWNINFFNFHSFSVLTYLNELNHFPLYLQQLDMESNGKSVSFNNNEVDYKTSPLLYGGEGCKVQHYFMQILHQGTSTIPVDFILKLNSNLFDKYQNILMFSCLSHSFCLMFGNNIRFNKYYCNAFKKCIGNRPSNLLIFNELTPNILGSLIAIYEHKIFVQGVIWGINSFDQFGVDLGKNLCKKMYSSEKMEFNLKNLFNFSLNNIYNVLRFVFFKHFND